VNNRYLIILFIVFCTLFSYSQEEEDVLSIDNRAFLENEKPFNPLSPAKAGFYSAIVPGLGQAYNRRYWKIPIIYGALATSLYYYSTNNSAHKRFRRAFRDRSAGKTDEFFNTLSTETLENSIKQLKTNRDTSLITFIGLYALQILEASVDAHLLQFNVSDKITFDPKLMKESSSEKQYLGLSLNFNF